LTHFKALYKKKKEIVKTTIHDNSLVIPTYIEYQSFGLMTNIEVREYVDESSQANKKISISNTILEKFRNVIYVIAAN
jgi:hypothetical protein